MMSVTDIDSKVIAITGASAGIGAATATLLAERGARLVLGARGAERLDALAASVGAIAVPTDVSVRADVDRLVQRALDEHGRLDALVANAGVMPIGPLDALEVDAWERMVDVNVKGVLYAIAAALPVFRAQGAGHFVFTGSTAAHRVVPSQSVYSGTKVAVRAIAEGLRQEAGPDLRVTLVSPGFTNTDSPSHMTDPAVRAEIERTRDAIAMPAEAVARAIAYALGEPAGVDVGEIIIRPTAQS